MTSLLDVLQIAHETQMPHEESTGNGGGASTIVIVAGVVVSLVLVAGLIWLKKRTETDNPETIGGEGT